MSEFQKVLDHVKDMPLLDALEYVAVWENDRAVRQALRGERDPHSGASYETCFRYCFKRVLEQRGLYDIFSDHTPSKPPEKA